MTLGFEFFRRFIPSYHEFCRKCTLIRKACIALRSGQYSVVTL